MPLAVRVWLHLGPAACASSILTAWACLLFPFKLMQWHRIDSGTQRTNLSVLTVRVSIVKMQELYEVLRPSDLTVRNQVSVRRVSALCASVMNEGCFYSTLFNSISSNPYRLHWWSLSVLLSVLDFLSLVLVESEWLVVYLFTLFREFKMSRLRQQRQRQKQQVKALLTLKCERYRPGAAQVVHTHRNIASARLAERVWCTELQSSFQSISFPLSGFQSSLLLIYFRDGPNCCSHCAIGAASLRHRSRAPTTVLTCEQKPYRYDFRGGKETIWYGE